MGHSCSADSHVAYRKARQSLGRSAGQRLNRRGYKAGLEDRLSRLSGRKQVSSHVAGILARGAGSPLQSFLLSCPIEGLWEAQAHITGDRSMAAV